MDSTKTINSYIFKLVHTTKSLQNYENEFTIIKKKLREMNFRPKLLINYIKKLVCNIIKEFFYEAIQQFFAHHVFFMSYAQ